MWNAFGIVGCAGSSYRETILDDKPTWSVLRLYPFFLTVHYDLKLFFVQYLQESAYAEVKKVKEETLSKPVAVPQGGESTPGDLPLGVTTFSNPRALHCDQVKPTTTPGITFYNITPANTEAPLHEDTFPGNSDSSLHDDIIPVDPDAPPLPKHCSITETQDRFTAELEEQRVRFQERCGLIVGGGAEIK